MNLKELSQNLGLSQTTVSRALNGYPEVSPATRRRVEEAAKTFNYSPSTRAKGLATGQALAIGHVIPLSSKHEMVNPIFGDFIAGAGETYSRHGYEMILSIVDDAEERRIYEGLRSRRAVDGVIVHGPRMNDPRITLLEDLGLPFAVHGRASGHGRSYTWLDVNNRRAFERATDFLFANQLASTPLASCSADQDICSIKRFCVSLGFFMCHIHLSRTEQPSVLYIETNVP